MIDKYIFNDQVARDKIAMDIKYRILKKDDIVKLCANNKINASFIGTKYSNKINKNKWNKDYLNSLSYAVVSESFNLDYLLYLDEVAEFVTKAKFKKLIIAGVIIVLVIISGVVVFSYILKGGLR